MHFRHKNTETRPHAFNVLTSSELRQAGSCWAFLDPGGGHAGRVAGLLPDPDEQPRGELTITGELPGMPELGDDDRIACQASPNAPGLERTVHVLEGIAAEGKECITHENRWESARLGRLVAAMKS